MDRMGLIVVRSVLGDKGDINRWCGVLTKRAWSWPRQLSADYGRLVFSMKTSKNLQRCHHLYETLGFDTFAVPEEVRAMRCLWGLEGFIGADTIRSVWHGTRQVYCLQTSASDEGAEQEVEGWHPRAGG